MPSGTTEPISKHRWKKEPIFWHLKETIGHEKLNKLNWLHRLCQNNKIWHKNPIMIYLLKYIKFVLRVSNFKPDFHFIKESYVTLQNTRCLKKNLKKWCSKQHRAVAMVGGAGLWSPLLTSRTHHYGLKSRLEPTTHSQKTW